MIKRRAYSAAVCEKARTATVTSVDLSRFLRMRSCPQDQIKVKMDVEGAEFNVLHHMLKQGTACWINVLQLEWHLHGKQLRAEAEDLNVRLTQCGVRLAFNCLTALKVYTQYRTQGSGRACASRWVQRANEF